MGLLSKEQILSAKGLVYEDVDCPEWGGTVRVASMSGRAAKAVHDAWAEGKGDADLFALVGAACIVDENGDRLFSEADMDALADQSLAPLQRILAIGLRLSGFGPEAVSGVEQDFDAAPSSSPTTTSPTG